MKRYAYLLFLFLAASPAAAQDIPLSQILIEGQRWEQAKGDVAELLKAGSSVVAANGFRNTIDDEKRLIRQESHRKGMPDVVALHKLPDVTRPAGITLWPDGRTMVVGDAEGKHLWAFRAEKDGSLTCGDRYYALRVKPGTTASGVTALTVDSKGLLYAATPLGVQVFDPTGRLCGVVANPDGATPRAIGFTGTDRDLLYVAQGDIVFVRKIQAKGVPPVEKKP
jgi:enterochelin esterase family protein